MKRLLLSLLAVVLIFEEWLWDILTAFGRWLVRLLHLARFERWLTQASPYTALLAFAIPLLIVTPLHVGVFWLLAHGLILHGLLLEIGAKLLATLLVARVFALTKTQLLTFSAFALLYNAITGWLQWAHARIAATAIYQLANQVKDRVKARFATLAKRSTAQHRNHRETPT